MTDALARQRVACIAAAVIEADDLLDPDEDGENDDA